MNRVTRRFCLECFHPVDVDLGEAAEAVTCDRCGGPIETRSEEVEPGDTDTPFSLLLTPESLDQTPWEGPFDDEGPAAGPGLVRLMSLGRFQLREVLGGGGFGQVYRAYDPRLDRDVALKVLRDACPSNRVMERFFREARAVAQLDHPSIVPLHDAGRDQGRCWIAYQFIEGKTLAHWRSPGEPPSIPRITQWVRDLAGALAHAHDRGVVHRDVKPSNIIIDASGRPRLTDFGLARRLEMGDSLTIEGTVLGTPQYMSPEQANGHGHEADARSDLYSLGVIFFELLCGSRPTDLPSGVPAWRVATLQQEQHVSVRLRNPCVPRALDQICRKALQIDPTDRYADAHALVEDLNHWLRPSPHPRWSWLLVAGAIGSLLPLAWENRPGFEERSSPGPIATKPPVVSRKTAASHLNIRPFHAEGPVVAVEGRSIYHRSYCFMLDRSSEARWRKFVDAQEAARAGLTPCQVCRPNESLKLPTNRSAAPGEPGHQ